MTVLFQVLAYQHMDYFIQVDNFDGDGASVPESPLSSDNGRHKRIRLC